MNDGGSFKDWPHYAGMAQWSSGRGALGPRWTRFEDIDSLFANSTWRKVRISFTTGEKWAVVTNRYCGPPRKLPPGGQFFHFRRRAGK